MTHPILDLYKCYVYVIVKNLATSDNIPQLKLLIKLYELLPPCSREAGAL